MSAAPTQRGGVWRAVFRLARVKPSLYLSCAVGVAVFYYLFPLVPGLVLRDFFDGLALQPGLDGTARGLLAVLVTVGVIRFAAIMIITVLENAIFRIGSTVLTRNILAEVLRRPGAKPLPSSTGDALARLQSDGDTVSSYTTFIFAPIGQLALMTVAVGVLYSADPVLTLAVAVPLVLTLLGVNALSRRIRSARLASMEAMGDVSGLLSEAFAGVQALQLAGAEDRLVDQLAARQDRRRRSRVADVVLSTSIAGASATLAAVAVGVILLLAATRVREGTLTIGELALFVSYVAWIAVVVSRVGDLIAEHKQVGVSLTRLLEMLPGTTADALTRNTPLYLRGPLPDPAPPPSLESERFERLSVEGLSYRHDGGGGILDLTFSISAGELIVVTGGVGSGKSTLLRTVIGLLPSQAGSVSWNRATVTDPGTFFVPPRCSYTPQAPRLFSGTLRENILMGLAQDDGGVFAAVRTAVLDADIAALPNGLDTPVGARGVRLSGGQVLRTAAARMLVRDAELYVIDDLSSGLDGPTESELWARVLQRGAKRPALLVAAHSPIVLRNADRILLLDSGRLIASGSLGELLESSAEMRSLWADEHGPEQRP